MLGKAKTLFQEGAFEEAIDAINAILDNGNYQEEAFLIKAKSFAKLENIPEAISTMEEALNLFPKNAGLYGEKAVLHFLIKDNAPALSLLSKAIDLEPTNPYRYASRGYILERLDQNEAALEDYTKALELDPEDAITHNNMGLLQEKMGRKNRAKKHYKKADDLDPIKRKKEKVQPPLAEQDKEIEAQKRASTIKKEEKISPQPSALSIFLQTLKALFTNKEERNAFLKFIKNGFRNK